MLASAAVFESAFSLGGAEHDWVADVVEDSVGNFYVAGEFTGTVDFDPGPGTALSSSNPGVTSGFVAQYSPTGEHIWTTLLPATSYASVYSVAVDAAGNVYAGGLYQGGLAVHSEPFSAGLSGFVAKLSSGNTEWITHLLGNSSTGMSWFEGVQVDSAGHIYAIANFSTPIEVFNGQSSFGSFTSVGGQDALLLKLNGDGSVVASHQIGGVGYDHGVDLAVDGADNVYLAGGFSDTVDFDSGTGTHVLTSAGSEDGFMVKLDSGGALGWVSALGGLSGDAAHGVAVDSAGSVYATGEFRATADFDPGPGVFEMTSASSAENGFVWKLGQTGGLVWARSTEGAANSGQRIAVDGLGGVYTVGNIQSAGHVDMDPGPDKFSLMHSAALGFFTGFVQKLDTNGDFVWASSIAGDTTALILDADGDIRVAGNFAATIDADPTAHHYALTSIGQTDAYVLQWNEGIVNVLEVVNLSSAFSLGGAGNEWVADLVEDSLGNFYVAGEFTDTVDFDPGPGTALLSSHSPGVTSGFVAKYSPTGEHVWTAPLPASSYASVYSVAVDAAGNVYAGGLYQGGLAVHSEPFSSGLSGFVARLNGSSTEWITHLQANSSTGMSWFEGVQVDSAGHVYAVANFSTPIEVFNGQSSFGSFTSAGGQDALLLKLNGDGSLLASHQIGGVGHDGGVDLAVDGADNVHLAGGFSDTVDFDSGIGSHLFTSAGSEDGFVLKLDSGGVLGWVSAFGSAGIDEGLGVTVDGLGNVYATGEFRATTDFDPGPGVFEMTSASSAGNGFVWKLDQTGGLVWVRSTEGAANSGQRIAVDGLGGVYTVGNILSAGHVDMDPGPEDFTIDAFPTLAFFTGFVSKLDADGDFAWARSIDGDTTALMLNAEGEVRVAGNFARTIDVDPTAQQYGISSSGQTDGFVVRWNEGVILNVDSETIAADLQETVDSILGSGSSAPPPEVIVPVDSDSMEVVIDAVEGLAPNTTGETIDIVLNLDSGTYDGSTIAVPAGYRLVINGEGGSVVFEGASPALTVSSGIVIIEGGVVFTNSTNAPTIFVNGGNLVIRNSIVHETTGGDQAAIEITGGTVDLGNAAEPGGNTINVLGAGELIRNLSGGPVSAIGNTFQVEGVALTSSFRVEDKIYHSLDAAGLGLVTYVAASVFVTPASGSIQRGVNAVASGGSVNVEGTSYADYAVGTKLATVQFTTGQRFSQETDPVSAGARSLFVTGTTGAEHIEVDPGTNSSEVDAAMSGVPTGTFAPQGRIVVFAGDGNDNIQIAGSIALPAWLYGGGGNDRLKGGAGHDLLFGVDGDDLLVGGSGRDLLIGGLGADRIVGNADDDILIAGYTAFDSNHVALSAIMAEWTSPRDYATRSANLSGTGSGPRHNADYFLTTQGSGRTVHDDAVKDIMTGSEGQDWFFANLESGVLDKVTDLSAEEFQPDLDFILSE